MAQTKRKRKTKHRGTAAGTVTQRGRTGRPLSPEEKKKQATAMRKEERLSKPPTWSGSFKRAAFAASLMFLFLLLIVPAKGKNANPFLSALTFSVLALLLYAPLGYWMEKFMFDRRMKKKAAGG
jgi:hypothetical protein